MSKQTLNRDYVVPPQEALWGAVDMSVFTTRFDQSQWDWTALILTPHWITPLQFRNAVDEVAKKKQPKSIARLRLAPLDEGTCVQTLHTGAYRNEGPVLKLMHEQFIPASNLQMRGKHHEIYFNDFRKVVSEKLGTILRQPVARASR